MKPIRAGLLLPVAAALLLCGTVQATTRDIVDLQAAPLTLGASVISELSAGVLMDPYDEFLRRPFNLSLVNIERYPNLSPWPGQEGEQNRYVDFLIGNNGNTNVRNGADTLQGTYIGQGWERLSWGASAAYLIDDSQNSDAAGTSMFDDGEKLMGFDLRLALGYRISNRMVLGGGLTATSRGDESRDSSFQQGVGGFFSLRQDMRQGFEGDFGLRLFTGERRSWEVGLMAGTGTTELDDYSEDLDAAGAVLSRFVVTEYDVSDMYVQVHGGYNRRYDEDQGEMQIQAGMRQTTHELDNNNLSYTDDGITITPSLTLLSQDPVSETEMFVSASIIFLRGWTEIFAGGRLSQTHVDGSTQADSLGVIVTESIDDTHTSLALVMGLRQPLWNERFRLVARARADWADDSRMTSFGSGGSGTEFTQTTTSYALGIETVLNNMVFDMAWLFGGEPAPGGAGQAARQTIDLDRLVISATFGW